MSKHKELNRLEAILNTLGGDENIDGILRCEIKVDLNPVHQRLVAITKRYEEELISTGAIIVGDRGFGVRDILFPVDCVGSEQDTFSEMKKAIKKRNLVFFEKHAKNYQLGSLEETESLRYVSLRNTMEYFKEKSEKLPYYWTVGIHDCDYLSGRDFFCFMTRYIDVFTKDWFGKEKPILPVAFGTRIGFSNIRCIMNVSYGEKGTSIEYISCICCEEYGPWLTV